MDEEQKITLRDFYFAAALQGIVAARAGGEGADRPVKSVMGDVALAAFYADCAMLKRNESIPPP